MGAKGLKKATKVVTIMDLAAETHISAKTISLALRGHPSVSRETAKHVQTIALKLGYAPRRERTGQIGITVPYITHLAYGELVGFIRALASSYDISTLIMETMGDPEAERKYINELSRRGIDGLILVSPRLREIDIENFSRARQPVVAVNVPIAGDSSFHFGSVEIDDEAGAYMAVSYLIERGCKSVAYLAGRPPSQSDRHRRRGYLNALASHGMNHDEQMVLEIGGQITTPWPNFKAGYDQCVQMLSKGMRPDAILAYNDVMAIGALRALQENDLKVPKEIAVIGFDNLIIGQFVNPSLTSVGVQWDKLAWLVFDTLLCMTGRSEGGGDATERKLHHKLVPDLIVRESVPRRAK